MATKLNWQLDGILDNTLVSGEKRGLVLGKTLYKTQGKSH